MNRVECHRLTFEHFPSGADIDTLCVAPRHVQREDFFTTMHDILKARAEVTEIAVQLLHFLNHQVAQLQEEDRI